MVAKYDILLVDDEVDLCDTIYDILTMSGYLCLKAYDPFEALKLIETETFNLIICDISMPKMNGLQLITKFKEKNLSSAVVMLTAHDDREKIVHAMQLGAIDYVTKPFDEVELSRKVPFWIELGKNLNAMKEESLQHEENATIRRLKMIDLYRVKVSRFSA